MKRPFITYLVFIFSIFLISNETASAKPPFIGVFNSGGEDSSRFTLIINDDGKGVVGVGGPFVWKLGPAKNQIKLTGSFAGDPKKADSVTVVFDPEKKEIKFSDEKLYRGESLFHRKTLYYTTNQIPEFLHNHLLHFDGTEWSLTHGCNDTIFVLSVTNHAEDLHKIENSLRAEGVYCYFNRGIVAEPFSNQPNLDIDERDVALARRYTTNETVKSSLTVQIRKSGDSNIFEIWENGKKLGEEHYKNGDPVPNWGRP
jgi:hypothetical protein